jgi:AraC family transcriptional regulator
MPHKPATRQVDAEVATRLGRVCTVRASWPEPIDSVGTPERHWLELSLLPRSRVARGCFPDQWGPHRFERIGALFLLPAGRTVHARSECPVQSSIVCAFDPAATCDWFDDAFAWTDGRLQGGLDLGSTTIRRLVFRLGEEVRSPGFASAALVELMTAQVAIELGRHFRGIGETGASGGLAPWRLRRIDERLAEQAEAPSLAELADLCGLSVRQLARGFRTSRGCSIGTYLAEYRVEQAKRLLAGADSVKRIAHATGFASPSSFSAAFRRATGETPRAFRERIGHGSAIVGGSPRIH